MSRKERFEIEVDSTPAEVWERLTTPGGLASWFGTRAEIELRIEGERVVGWGDEMEIRARITDIEPGQRLRLVYTTEGESTGAEEWLITTSGKMTRLTLINSFSDDDIDDWEGFFGDVRRGWHLFLASLKHGLEEATTPDRRADSSYIPAPGPREEIWVKVEQMLEASPDLIRGMRPIVVDPPHSRLLAGADRTLLIDVEGAGDYQVLYIQAATHDGSADWRTRALALARMSVGE